jgi:hypothetical protein
MYDIVSLVGARYLHGEYKENMRKLIPSFIKTHCSIHQALEYPLFLLIEAIIISAW